MQSIIKMAIWQRTDSGWQPFVFHLAILLLFFNISEFQTGLQAQQTF